MPANGPDDYQTVRLAHSAIFTFISVLGIKEGKDFQLCNASPRQEQTEQATDFGSGGVK